MADIKLLIKNGGCPIMAIPCEMRLKINAHLIEPGYTHSKFHGNFIMPERELNTSALLWPPQDLPTNSYDALASTCRKLRAEMHPLRGNDLYNETLFILHAFFRGPVSRLDGRIFHLPTFAPMRHIERLDLRVTIPRGLSNNHLDATMANIPGIINGMPMLQTLHVSVDFTVAPSSEHFTSLMTYLAAIRAPALYIGTNIAGLIAWDDSLWFVFNSMLVVTRAVDTTNYDAYRYLREDEEGWRAGFPVN